MAVRVGRCQSWEGGFYTAWRSIADEAFDLVVHYGDYIYENRHVRRIGKAVRSRARCRPTSRFAST